MVAATDRSSAPVISLQIDALAVQRVRRWTALGLLPGFKLLHQLSEPVNLTAVAVDDPADPCSQCAPPADATGLLGALLAGVMPNRPRLDPDSLALAWQALAGDSVSVLWSRQLIDDLQRWRRFSRQWCAGQLPARPLRLCAAERLAGFVPVSRQSGEAFAAAQATRLTYQAFDGIIEQAIALAGKQAAELVVFGPQYRCRLSRANRPPQRLAA